MRLLFTFTNAKRVCCYFYVFGQLPLIVHISVAFRF